VASKDPADPAERLPTSVQKSYFLLGAKERDVLNQALSKYRPGPSEPILIGGEKLLKPALKLMSFYRLRIDEIKEDSLVTSYTRWLEAVIVKGERTDCRFAPRFHNKLVEQVFAVDDLWSIFENATDCCHNIQFPLVLHMPLLASFCERQDKLACQNRLVTLLLVHRPNGVAHLRYGGFQFSPGFCGTGENCVKIADVPVLN